MAGELAFSLGAQATRVYREGGVLHVEMARDTPRTVELSGLCGKLSTVPPNCAVLGVDEGGVPLLRRRPPPQASWRPEAPPAYPQFAQPNIIVLNPADLLGQRGGQSLLNLPQPPPLEALQEAGLRRLRVVGDDEDWR